MAESRTPPLHKDPGVQCHCHSHPCVRCRDLGSLLKAGLATGAVSPMLFVFRPWHQMARPHVERRSPQKSQPAQHSPSCFRCSCVGLATSQDICMPKAVFFCKLQEGKCNCGALRKRYKDQLKRQLAQVEISHQSWQQEASD